VCRRSPVEHRDRPGGFGFGFECIETVLSVPCRNLLVLIDDGVADDLGARYDRGDVFVVRSPVRAA
jgi:hypothetical protein